MLIYNPAQGSPGQGHAQVLKKGCANSNMHAEVRPNPQLYEWKSKHTSPWRWSDFAENGAHIYDAKTMDLAMAKCQLLPEVWVCLNLLKYWQNQKMQLNSRRTTQFFSNVSNTRNFSSYERKNSKHFISQLYNHKSTSSSYNKNSVCVLCSKRGSFQTCPLTSLPKFTSFFRKVIFIYLEFSFEAKSLLSSER